jgi:predicted dehydrogenase
MKETGTMDRRSFLKQTALTSAALTGAAFLPAHALAEGAPRVNREKVRVGLIGCGSVSGSYLPNLTSHSYIDVVSVCDIIPERAEKRAREFKVPNHYPHIDKMLAGAEFDLLVNTTSMPSHFPVNKRGLEAGKHVWSEKPMAHSVKDGRELIALAKQKGVGFWAAPDCVLSPQFKFMVDTIASGKLGRITAAHGIYGHNGPTWSAWFYQQGGGSLYDLGVYNVTTLTGLLGPVKEVMGMTSIVNPTRKVDDKGTIKVEADENTMLMMKHASGALSHIQTGFVYFPQEHLPHKRGDLFTIDVMGTNGSMHMQAWDWAPTGIDIATWDNNELETFSTEPGDYKWQGGASYVAKCLLAGIPSLITPEHGLHVLEVMLACHESQRSGRRIDLETTFDWPIFKS